MVEKLPKGIGENLQAGEEVLFAVKKKMGVEKPKWLVVTFFF